MADIAIFRINYKSDFILTLQSDAGWLTPFCIKFWTGAPSKAYYAYYDGMSYTHCTPVEGDPTKLLVQFDDHHLPIGDLKFQIGYHFTVADFPTSIEDEVINQASVIIEVDDAPAQVMLDFNGETAPEIEFSLPAYANEAQRIANEQARIAAEEQRIANEQARISAEETRQANEQQRINAEAERVSDFASMKTESEAATAAANIAATLANEKAQLADDKAALAQAAATLANAKAQLAADKAALAQAAATLANEKAALAQQKAEYAQEQGDAAKTEAETAHALNEEVRDDEEARDQAEQIRQQQETARQQAESQRVTDFNTQMQQQQTAYTEAEAARETAFNEAEHQRDAKVDEKVADITNLQAQVGYFVCDTGASVAAKTIAATGYALTTGGNIRIKMTNANTADSATLNINSTGAKALFYNGVQASSTNSWEAGEVIFVYFDGTNYRASNAMEGVMVEGTARTITNFDDWEDGFYDDRGMKKGVGSHKSSIIKLLKGQTITTLTQGPTYIAELDFTRLAENHTPGWRQGATEYTNTSNKNKLIRVVISLKAGGGAQTVPSVVTLSDVGKDVEKKSNVVGWGEGEEWEDTVSALDLVDTVITTEKDAFWRQGSIITTGEPYTRYGSLYIFENTGYCYLYAYNLAGNNRYYRSCALYSGEPSADTCIKLFTFPPSGILRTEIPSNCRYIYVSAYQDTDASIDNRQTKILLFKDGSLLPFKYLLENFQLVKDTTIFDATSELPALYDKYGRYIDIRNNFAYPSAATSNFRFIFCSDVHKNTDAFERIINITNRWAADGCVDALINTGDVAYDRPDESYDWYNQMRIKANVDVLTVPGNHDWNYSIGGDKERTYNNIIAPMVSGAEGTVDNIVQPSDASEGFKFYYYKDYKTVRFIAIYASVDSTEQLEWLVSVLEDARINNKHVIIGNHQSFASGLANMKYATPDAWYNNVPNTFFSGFGSIQSSSAPPGGGDITAAYCQAVKDFMDAGGVFVCWISGHHHIDHFYDLNDTDTYGHQLMLNTGCVRQDELDGDSVRKGSIGNKDLYNFVSVSTDIKMLKVLRIGSNVDYLGRSKIVFTYNYGIHKIIANY